MSARPAPPRLALQPEEAAAAVVAAMTARAAPPRLALRQEEAAAAVGVSPDFFTEHIAHELRWIRRGRLKLVPVSEIALWLDRNAALTLPDGRGR